MEMLFSIVFIAIIGVVILLALKKNPSVQNISKAAPYYTKKLLSTPEQVLYHRLVKALPEYIILAQVQVSRVLGVKKGANFMEWNNKINRLSYDFLICAKDSMPIIAIELDDKSHTKENRIATDNKKDSATKDDAGLKIIRWNAAYLPNEIEIQTLLS